MPGMKDKIVVKTTQLAPGLPKRWQQGVASDDLT